VITASARRTLLGSIAVCALVGGSLAALQYHRLGLTLSHYDARGHLVVARRVFDSITPGWQQIGAVWLPLPHLLNSIPVQIDLFYRSGASAVAISIASFAIATAAIAAIVLSLTASTAAAIVAAAAFALNPNVVYLQSTPMTEPLLLALTTLAVAMLIGWTQGAAAESRALRGDRETEPQTVRGSAVGIVFALACLTRYEAWPVTYTALAAAAWALWRSGVALPDVARRVARVAWVPTVAIVCFAVFSRIVIGEWLVASGFFVPENKALGAPMMAAEEIAWGTQQLSGRLLVALALGGVGLMAIVGVADRRRADWLVAVSLLATAVVPWSAFVDGHPFRIRYMVPLVAFEATAIGAAVGFLASRARAAKTPPGPFSGRGSHRWDLIVAGLVALVVLYELRPLDGHAPMVVEAQWDRPNVSARKSVTDCLKRRYEGDTIMASMGSLGHYMQETSHDGFALRDFLHEGNGDIWLAALERPEPFAGWILIEEKAEGGDMLARQAREHPHFLDGYSRACEGAGVALYERQNRTLNVKR